MLRLFQSIFGGARPVEGRYPEREVVLGVALDGEILKRDVPQITVSFANHRVVDPATTLEETRRLLKRRAFDHVLGTWDALPLRAESGPGLTTTRTSAPQAHDAQFRRWGFDEARGKTVTDVAEIEAQLARIEKQLQGRADAGVLRSHLDMLSEVLSRAEQQLWATPITLILDRMNIKRDQARDNALEVGLEQLHSASRRT